MKMHICFFKSLLDLRFFLAIKFVELQLFGKKIELQKFTNLYHRRIEQYLNKKDRVNFGYMV